MRGEGCWLRDDVVDDVAGDVGEAEVSATGAVGELGVVDAHEVEDGGVDVVDVDGLVDDLPAEVVGGTVGDAAFDAATGEPHAEAVGVVVAASVGASASEFDYRGAAKLRAADDDGFVEEATSFEVFDECSEGLIGVFSVFAVCLNILMGVPGVALRVIDLHHADATLDEACGGEAAACGTSLSVHFDGGGTLFADVEDIGSFGLHAIGGLHGADGGFELRIGLSLGHIEFVELLDEVEFVALLLDVKAVVVDIGDELVGIKLFLAGIGGDVGSLVDRGEEGRAPEWRANGGGDLRTEDDESGEVLVVSAETVGEPGAHGWSSNDVGAGVHHDERGLVVGDLSEYGADDTDVVDALADVGKELADFDAALAVLFEFEGGLHERASFALVAEVATGHGLTVVLGEHWLGVEAVDVGEATVHEEEDDVLGSGFEVGILEHPGTRGGGGDGGVAGERLGLGEGLADHAGEAHHGEAATDTAEGIAAVDRLRLLA